MAGLQVTTEPTAEPLSLQEVKEYLRVDDSTDERVVRPLIETARRWAETHMNRSIMSQTLTLQVDAFDELAEPLWEGSRQRPADLNYYKRYISLPRPTVTSVTSVSTFNDSDTETTFASSKYYVDTAREPARIVLRKGETFPTALRVANAIKVVYVSGYTNAYSVPEPIRMGMLQHIAFMYEQRGDNVDYLQHRELPRMIKSLYAPFVVYYGLSGSPLMQLG